MRRQQEGFTLIEVLVVVAIIGILANIAIPNAVRALRRAQASRIVSDFLLVRHAVIEYHRDTGAYPRDYYPGGEPRELKPYLQGKVQWSIPSMDVKYDWENWVRANGTPKHRFTGVLYGMSITTTNMSLVDAIREIYDGPFHYTLGRNYTFVMTPIDD